MFEVVRTLLFNALMRQKFSFSEIKICLDPCFCFIFDFFKIPSYLQFFACAIFACHSCAMHLHFFVIVNMLGEGSCNMKLKPKPLIFPIGFQVLQNIFLCTNMSFITASSG